MVRNHLELSLAVALALGVGLTACGGGSSPQATDAATVDSTPATPSASQPPSSAGGAEAEVAQATSGAEAATPAATPTGAGMRDGTGEATTAPAVGKALSPAALPLLVVTKTPTCGCCHLWVEHMQKAGFKVDVRDVNDLTPVKARVGVPYGKGSCHTAEVGGYFIEGHVPAEDVKRLLAEKPDAKGLTVPGMPLGSPGMETPDGRVQPYAVELVAKDGSTSPFAHHGH